MISKLIQHILRFFTCQQSNSLCIIVLYNGGSKAPIRLLGRGRSCLINVRPGMLGLGMVLKEIHLAYSTRFLFREQDLYLETWSWSPLICTEKAFGSGYMGLRERMYFIIFVYYANIKVFHFIYFSLTFIYLYVSFLLAYDQCFV